MSYGTDTHSLEEGGSHGGLDRYMGPTAKYYSHMPETMIDGQVEDQDAPEDVQLSHEAASSPDEAAQRLQQMRPRPATPDSENEQPGE
jgi:hypothetical protein